MWRRADACDGQYVRLVAGATLCAARLLCLGDVRVAINWHGGWHHAQRDQAAGFCYANDIVLGILALRRHFSRVLYVDLDLHHGDGVEGAFAGTERVLCVSIHKFAPTFFPGTGGLAAGDAPVRAINVPLRDGCTDARFIRIFDEVVEAAFHRFKPGVVVLQCGADTLASDPHQAFNLTTHAPTECVRRIMAWGVSTLVLGGGGYHHADTARCWTAVTHAILTATSASASVPPLPDDIPEHAFFTIYRPHFSMAVLARPCRDTNDDGDYTRDMLESVRRSIHAISAPY